MSRKIFFIAAALTLSFFKCYSQNTISRLIIKYVSSKITTPVPVTCEIFEKSFHKNQMRERIIGNKDTLNSFEKNFINIKYSKDTSKIDVRTKIYVFLLGKQKPKIICIDKFEQASIDGMHIRINKHLKKIIKELIN